MIPFKIKIHHSDMSHKDVEELKSFAEVWEQRSQNHSTIPWYLKVSSCFSSRNMPAQTFPRCISKSDGTALKCSGTKSHVPCTHTKNEELDKSVKEGLFLYSRAVHKMQGYTLRDKRTRDYGFQLPFVVDDVVAMVARLGFLHMVLSSSLPSPSLTLKLHPFILHTATC